MTVTPPTLSDDRIETMRSTVLNAVDTDVARRGTRARRSIGLAAASVLVVGFGGYAVNQGGSGPSADDSASSAGDAADSRSAAGGSTEFDSSDGALAASPDTSKPVSKDQPARQVIVTGTVNVTVKEPKDVARLLSTYVDSIGGRVDERTQSNDSGGGSAFLKVRIPSTKVSSTIEHLKKYGTVNDVSLQNDDVTTQAEDLDARIKALKLSIGRLEKIMSAADTSGEVIKAESALTARQEQLESLQTQRASIADQVQLSTLSIDLSQKTKAQQVSPGGFHGGLVDGWNALVDTVNHIVKVVGVLLPWTAIAVALYGVYLLVTRRRRS